MRLAGLVVFLGLTATARADYWTEQQEEKLRQIEYAQQQATRPAWFDGQRVAPGTSLADASNAAQRCDVALERFGSIYKTVDASIRAKDRARAVERRHAELGTWCPALSRIAAAMAAAAKAEAEAKVRDEAADQERRRRLAAFHQDVPSDARQAIDAVAHFADPRFDGPVTIVDDDAHAAAIATGLAALRPICARHAPLENPRRPYDPRSIYSYPELLCSLPDAADRLITAGQRAAIDADLAGRADDVRQRAAQFLAGELTALSEDAQRRVYDRDAWQAALDQQFRPRFARLHQEPTADVYAPLFAQDDAIRARVDQRATAVFARPPFHDRGAEAAARKAWARHVKGAKLVAIGTSFKNWDVQDEKVWVKSDSTYDYYRVHKGKNRYQRGWVLLQIPGRPYCQVREWSAARQYSGPIEIDGLADEGVFYACK